ncbi:prokineticin receptor 2-like [Acanthaster planci]|uniref:Prokineticin receptor 2-like n=1 Tax=Acanthaster planci TaxID=133434 RepID=A0A8B7XZM9_ACAPL|nr:prokineticin receptor 2-like [Acanthaster planci]XP_022086365.1 prokineticin receptor 2-like [Acanthaster planci]
MNQLDDQANLTSDLAYWNNSQEFSWGHLGSEYFDTDCAVYIHPVVKVFLAVTFILTIVISGVGDSLLVFIILFHKRLRTVTNLMIANLAVSDALMALLSAPFTLHYYMTDNWAFGSVMCRFVGTVKNASLFVSVNTLLVIAVDRFVGIFNPLRPRMGKGTLSVILCSIWSFSVLITIPTPLYTETSSGFDCRGEWITFCSEMWHNPTAGKVYVTIITVVEFVMPALVMGVVYIKIATQLWFHRHPPGHETPRHREITLVRKQKIIPMLITVVVAFFLCWAPYYAYNLVWHFHANNLSDFSFQYSFYFIVESVAMLNAVISTVIYFIMSPVFREEFWCLLYRFLPFRGFHGRHGRRKGFKNGSQQASRTGSGFSQTMRNGHYHAVPRTTETAEAHL